MSLPRSQSLSYSLSFRGLELRAAAGGIELLHVVGEGGFFGEFQRDSTARSRRNCLCWLSAYLFVGLQCSLNDETIRNHRRIT